MRSPAAGGKSDLDRRAGGQDGDQRQCPAAGWALPDGALPRRDSG